MIWVSIMEDFSEVILSNAVSHLYVAIHTVNNVKPVKILWARLIFMWHFHCCTCTERAEHLIWQRQQQQITCGKYMWMQQYLMWHSVCERVWTKYIDDLAMYLQWILSTAVKCLCSLHMICMHIALLSYYVF